MKPVKIIGLEMENVKRVAVLRMEPSANGLTVIGGDNGQGKTSVLDAICFALGGEKHRPSNLRRDGAIDDPYIKLTMSNGLVAERKGKNATLKITDPSGKKSGQSILDAFTEELALDLNKFMSAKGKDKAQHLLLTLGIGDKLAKLEDAEQKLYNERHGMGQIADRKKKYADELVWHDGVPDTPMTAAELLAENQQILQRNAEKQNARNSVANIRVEVEQSSRSVKQQENAISRLQQELEKANEQLFSLQKKEKAKSIELSSAESEPVSEDESTAEIETKINEIEEINAKVRRNLEKTRANSEATAASSEVDKLTEKIDALRSERMKLLDGAKMPLPGLSVEDGELSLNGKKWDCMSGSEQLRASVAIVRSLKPQCGFVLIDGLESMDVKTMNEFAWWLGEQELQAIATRVSKGGECSIVIDDGRVEGVETVVSKPTVEADADMEGF